MSGWAMGTGGGCNIAEGGSSLAAVQLYEGNVACSYRLVA